MSDTKCAHCGAGMHRLTRWCQKCGKSAGNPVIPITYPTMPVSTTSKSSASFPAIPFSQTESASMQFTFAPSQPTPPPAPTPTEKAPLFNFLPQSMQPVTRQEEGTKTSTFNLLPQSMQPAQTSILSTTASQAAEYAAVDHGYAATQFDGSGVWQEGNLVVAIKDATFPNRCIKCNDIADTQPITRKLTWYNPGLLYLCGPLIYLIVSSIMGKQVTVRIPLCTKHKENRKIITIVGCSIIGLAFMMTVPSYIFGVSGGYVIMVLMLLIGIIVARVGMRLVTPTKIENDYVWMKGACKEFRHQLPSV